MAWSFTKKTFGVCGNFRFAFYNLTDIKATRSVVKPEGFNSVKFLVSTNTTDNADVLAGKTLAWTGTADTDVANELKDTSQVFDSRINGLQVANTADTVGETNPSLMADVVLKDADELYTFKHEGSAYDCFPDGNETYTIYNERVVQFIAVSANDDGTVLLMGD